jgi:pyruvate dehydrogenase E2 component (dihydrolipoamide acetyltransferase)
MATEKIFVPDFGNVQDITVVEVYVSAGDTVKAEDSLIALESEKAVMDIPAPVAGLIKEVYLRAEDVVKSGDVIALVEVTGEGQEGDDASGLAEKETGHPAETPATVEKTTAETDTPELPAAPAAEGQSYHASPSVRAYARQTGVELSRVVGTGPKGRIVKEDVQALVKPAAKGGRSEGAATAAGDLFAEEPLPDFTTYGAVEEVALSRIRRIAGPHLHRSWLTIPHVTHFDEADITELESFRRQLNDEAAGNDIRFSPLVFIVKAVVAALRAFPLFNCSLVPGGAKVIVKHYYNIGIAVDTPQGLVVPVIRDADKKGMREIAVDLQRLSQAARQGKLSIADIQGASFTISSLGGIGGTGFTPIVNAPQVAILGLSKNYLKPVWQEKEQGFVARLTLPFSLSYDHRVIDGAEAARFCRSLSKSIEDLKRALL